MAKRRGQLRVDEFVTFYKMLTYRPELMHIIHMYVRMAFGTSDTASR